MARSGQAVVTVLGAVLTLLGGCRAFDASLLDAGTAPDAGRTCVPHRPPARPAGPDGEGEERIYVVKDVVLDQRGDLWREIGYDLDGLCSQEPAPTVECRAPVASAPPEIDGVAGTDNALGHNVMPVVLVARPDFQEHARAGISQGLGAIMLIIRGYDGEADDSRVDVIVTQTVWGAAERIEEEIESVDVSGFMLRVNGVPRDTPRWDGNDWFWAAETSFLAGDLSRPRLRDDNAYVADHTLVVRLPDRFPLLLAGDQSGVSVILSDVYLTARLSADGEGVEDLLLAGRWSSLDILVAIAATGICPGSPDYGTLQRLLDYAADLRTVPGTGGPAATCDAVSAGLRFESGTRANLADTYPPFELPNPCLSPRDAGPGDGGAPDAAAGDAGVLPDAG